jgi:multisubunit Na+/H+ antiporter MnhC subunit
METRRVQDSQGPDTSSGLQLRLSLCAAVVAIYFSLFAALLKFSRSAAEQAQAAASLWPTALVATAMVCFVALTAVFVFVRRAA